MRYIEVFESKPKTKIIFPPLLFIHGACLGAWCWTDGFLDFFADAGYHALALNLRGHGNSDSNKPLNKLSIDDYVEDVVSVANKLDQPPVIIGHSMGGLVAQRFAARRATPAVILMSPSPYAGMQSQAKRLFRAHPWSFFVSSLRRNIYHIYRNNDSVRDIMFSPNTPEEIVTRCRERLQKESWLVSQEMTPPLRKPHPIKSPMLVLGGEHDGTVLPDAICDTAKVYNATCHIFEGMGHNLMLEPGWPNVAEYMIGWIQQIVES
ncbi:MAG: alpha/beta fold hydrolase [Nitrospirales bacterium]|nr:alpha/beta fold hydrolase [Nitrospirales bacterium]